MPYFLAISFSFSHCCFTYTPYIQKQTTTDEKKKQKRKNKTKNKTNLQQSFIAMRTENKVAKPYGTCWYDLFVYFTYCTIHYRYNGFWVCNLDFYFSIGILFLEHSFVLYVSVHLRASFSMLGIIVLIFTRGASCTHRAGVCVCLPLCAFLIFNRGILYSYEWICLWRCEEKQYRRIKQHKIICHIIYSFA